MVWPNSTGWAVCQVSFGIAEMAAGSERDSRMRRKSVTMAGSASPEDRMQCGPDRAARSWMNRRVEIEILAVQALARKGAASVLNRHFDRIFG